MTKETDETGIHTISGYDEEGKLRFTEDKAGHRTTYTYRGTLQETVTNPLGHVTRTEYFDDNKVKRTIDAEGGIAQFEYDKEGNRTKVIDPVGNVTTFIYDKNGRIKEEINALGHKRLHAYDPAGNRVESIDRNGRRRTFEFDAVNRMRKERWWGATDVIRTLEYDFNEIGLQTTASDPAARHEYTYDTLNRSHSAKSAVPGLPDFVLTYSYNKNGLVTSVTDNSGVSIGSAYDTRGRLGRRNWQGPGIDPLRVDFTYDGANRRTRIDRFIDVAGTQRVGQTASNYNSRGLPESITHKGFNGTSISSHVYAYDAANRITEWIIDGENSSYTYDKSGQLLTADYATQPYESYSYDKNGNRINPGYRIGSDNQLIADGVNTYTYDNEGNIISRMHNFTGTVMDYEYDYRNRLVGVTERNGLMVTQTVRFTFDAVNKRLSESVNGITVRFLYSGNSPWADVDQSAAVFSRYLPGERVDEMHARWRSSDGAGWYLSDHLGSIRDIVARLGAPVAKQTMSSFGYPINSPTSESFDRFGFTGREYTSQISLFHYRARSYDPAIARFLRLDPIGFNSGDYSLYRYVKNNPIWGSDPTGTATLVELSSKLTVAVLTRGPAIILGVLIGASVIEVAVCASTGNDSLGNLY